jgi:hypothetical protein
MKDLDYLQINVDLDIEYLLLVRDEYVAFYDRKYRRPSGKSKYTRRMFVF